MPLILVICGYGLAFWMLTLVVRSIPVGIAYAIWGGLGIVLTAIVISFGMTALLVVLAIRARFEAGEERSDVPAVSGAGVAVSSASAESGRPSPGQTSTPWAAGMAATARRAHHCCSAR